MNYDVPVFRYIAAFKLGPRIRATLQPKHTGELPLTFDEDEKVQLAVEGIFTGDQISAAYDFYVTALASAFEIDTSLDHDKKVREIAMTIIGRGKKRKEEFDGFAPFNQELMNKDIEKIRRMAAEYYSNSPDPDAPPPPPVETCTVPAFRPVGPFEYDPKKLVIADTAIQQGTGKKFQSAVELIKKLHAAEAEVLRLRKEGATRSAIPQSEPSYTIVRKLARDVFKDAIPTKLQPNDLNFPVDFIQWNEPHPKVPIIRPEFTFDAEKLTPLLWCIENGYNSVLVGPPGCGKTTVTEQIAARLGRPWFRIPIDGEMRRREIIGGFKQVVENGASTTKWFDGIALQAMRLPAIIDVDEIDRGDPDLQYLAHQLYEGNGITILEDEGRMVYPHPKLAIMATANTKGRADGMNLYSLGQEMSEATRDRFAAWIDFDYQTEENEIKQIRKEVQNLPLTTATNIIRIAGAMRIAMREGKLRSAFSYRQVKACARYASFQNAILKDETKACVEAVKTIIVNRGSDEAEAAAIAELARKVMGDDWPAEENTNP